MVSLLYLMQVQLLLMYYLKLINLYFPAYRVDEQSVRKFPQVELCQDCHVVKELQLQAFNMCLLCLFEHSIFKMVTISHNHVLDPGPENL